MVCCLPSFRYCLCCFLIPVALVLMFALRHPLIWNFALWMYGGSDDLRIRTGDEDDDGEHGVGGRLVSSLHRLVDD